MAQTDTIELLWDFRGPDAEAFAQHHAQHLREFVQAEGRLADCGHRVINEVYAIAFVRIPAAELLFYRDRLKPQRGVYV